MSAPIIKIPAALYEALLTAKHGPKYLRELHPKQRALVDDPSKRKSALCGRRSGKTTGLTAWLVDGCEKKPKTRSLFITLNAAKAKQIVWDNILSGWTTRLGVNCRLSQPRGQNMVVFPNGSSIWLVGCKDRSEIEKFRGEPFYRIVVDEAQAFGDWLKPAIEEALEPTLMDWKGSICLSGTPSAAAAGYFWQVTTGREAGWSTGHHWTIADNPFFPDWERELAETRERNGWTEQNPTYIREWLGEWCDDPESLIYPFTYDKNYWKPDGPGPYGLPEGEYTFGLGIDLGYSANSTAFVFVARHEGTPNLYVLRAWTRSELAGEALSAHVLAFEKSVIETAGQSPVVVVDEGAIGKALGALMRQDGVGNRPAEKTDKRVTQDYVHHMIASGAVLVRWGECGPLLDEAKSLQWDPETGKEDTRYVRHCCDAFLYISRRLRPSYVPVEEPPKPGSPEALQAEMKKLKQEAIRAAHQRRLRD